jgi:Methylamine utilisation protein MauE
MSPGVLRMAAEYRSSSRAQFVGERLCAAGAAVLLLRSAFAHVANPYAFLDTVYSYRLLPQWAGPWVAAVVPFLQLVLGICLLARWWPRTSFVAAIILFLAFAGAQVSALARGLDIACGCFGSSENLRIGWKTLAVAGGGAAACGLGVVLAAREGRQCDTSAEEPSR